MRTREKLTLEQKFSLALELIKRERTLEEIRRHYRVSHTTAYKIRKAFLDGGRAALEAERQRRPRLDLEARVAALEDRLGDSVRSYGGNGGLGGSRIPAVADRGNGFAGRVGK
jgi:hypothetical protein